MNKNFLKPKKVVSGDAPVIKLMLDYKTVITIRNENALKMWKERYPNARVIAG